MFNPKIFIPASLALIAGAVSWFTVLSSEIALFALFPEIDQKVVIKAHRIMLRRTLAGKYNHLDLDKDEINEKIFLGIVQEITK